MFEVRFLIPVASNEGETFTAAHHAQFVAHAIDLFGGVTNYGSAQGAWMDKGVIYSDATIVYAVAVKSITDGSKVGELVTYAKAHYGQLAIYITYLGQAEIL